MPDINLKPVKVLSLTFGIIIISFLPIGFVSGWGNGKSGCSYANDNLSYDYDCNFGTHDWIAKSALNALIEDNSSKWSWLSDREKIYLVGTEAPDNSGVNMTLDGVTVEGFGDNTYHHIYFNEDGTIKNNEDDAALRAKSCGDLADMYGTDDKLDLAAFYLGAMVHYIGDLSMYAHVADNNTDPHYMDFATHHSTIEGYVQTRSNEYDNITQFFQISSFSIGSKKPYDAAISLAWDTYKDPNPSESTIRDAVWLHNNHFTGWKQTFSTRDDDTVTHQLYYDRIEENLNNAIQVSAAAINNITGLTEIDLIPTADFTANYTLINMSSNSVQFEFNGSFGDIPTEFQWNFGDGSTNSTERNPVHKFNSTGNYTIILTIIDVDGDEDNIIKKDYIQVISENSPQIFGYDLSWLVGFVFFTILTISNKIKRKIRK